MNSDTELRFATFLYRFRWPLSLVVIALSLALTFSGGARIGGFAERMALLGDTTNGSGSAPPLVFDPRMDLWFGAEDQAVQTYREIEERFVAEDYIMVAFEAPDAEFGVFDREALAAIARLTEGFLEIPGVRHVRSLTSNPWIRYGDIVDERGTERGLLISDLVEGAPQSLSDDELVERMVAVLGAARTAERIGERQVRRVLGPEADFDNFIGEPLLLGTILDESGSTTAIQIQVLRPLVDEAVLTAAFGESSERSAVAKTLYSVEAQRSSLRGIEHVLRIEQGLAVETPERADLAAWVASLPEHDERRDLENELVNPTRNFMVGPTGELIRKYHEYELQTPASAGQIATYVDRSNPAGPLPAPAGFQPAALSPFEFHVGGVPLFERNFEDVGMSDSKYMGLMFLAIALLLALVFRNLVGVAIPMLVVFMSVAAMVGAAFAKGDLLNNMTIIAPNMLTAVAIADSVHLIAAWASMRSRYDERKTLIIDVLKMHALPVFLTSVTTAVGFYSLTISEMIPVKMLGYTTGFGTIVAYLLSMTVVPACLSLVPHKPAARSAAKPARWSLMKPGWEQRLAHFVFRLRGRIVSVASVALVVALVGIWNLRVDSDFRAMFPDDNPVMSDFNWIESRMGGVGDLEIVFEGLEPDASEFGVDEQARLSALRLRRDGAARSLEGLAALDAAGTRELEQLEQREHTWKSARVAVSGEFLQAVDAFETRLREEMADPDSPLSVVTDLISPLDVLRRMHQVQNENQAAFYRVPVEADVPAELRTPTLAYDEWTEEWTRIPPQDSSTLAAQYYLQYENGARPGENLATRVSLDRRQFRIQGRIKQAPSQLTVQAGERIAEIARTEFPSLRLRVADTPPQAGERDLKISGKMLLFARTNRLFTIGFIKSMAIALTVITLLIGLIFRSVRIALVSIIPNVLPIALPLSLFGLLGKPLDAPAIFVSSVALGVCVDDSIHFFTKFMLARRRGLSLEQAVQYVYESSGMAITVTSVILVLGFGMLILSDFAPNYMMGSLAASMIALAWVADLLVTPAVLSYMMPEHDAAPSDAAQPNTLETVEAV